MLPKIPVASDSKSAWTGCFGNKPLLLMFFLHLVLASYLDQEQTNKPLNLHPQSIIIWLSVERIKRVANSILLSTVP